MSEPDMDHEDEDLETCQFCGDEYLPGHLEECAECGLFGCPSCVRESLCYECGGDWERT